MKFAFGFFAVVFWLISCASQGVSPTIVKGMEAEGVHADSLVKVYSGLKLEFLHMADMLRVLPEATKQSIPDYPKFASQVMDYREKMSSYEDDLVTMRTAGESFAAEVAQGKYTQAAALEKLERTNKERIRMEEAVSLFKKELGVLSAPYQKAIQALPNEGKDLLENNRPSKE